MARIYMCILFVVLSCLTAATPALGGTRMLTRYIPIGCNVANDSIAIETIDMDSIGSQNASRREFDFSSDGITLRTGRGIPTAADYSDIEDITYVEEEANERGLLTLNFRTNGEQSEELGYVQTACWNALMAFFKRQNIDVKVEVKKANSSEIRSSGE